VKIAAIVLAAGASTRMGSPKQLLMVNGRTMLDRAIAAVSALPVIGVTVVLGANSSLIERALKSVPRRNTERSPGCTPGASAVAVVINSDWSDGMGGSIRTGVAAALADHSDLDGILITLCDQLCVDAPALSRLLDHFRPEKTAVAAGYAGTVGVPAVFGRSAFESLLNLKSSGGAKPILSRSDIIVVQIPEAEIDVDTPDDFSKIAK